MRDEDRQVRAAEREVGGGVDRDHAGHGAGGAYVDGTDEGMRVGRPDQDRFERAVVDVIREAAVAAQEPVVLDALYSLSEPAGGQLLCSPLRAGARRFGLT